MIGELILTFFLVALNGFFVAAEFAIVKVRSSQVEIKAKDGSRVGITAKHIVSNLDAYLSATQLGITLASLGLGWVGEAVVSDVLINLFNSLQLNLSPELAHKIAFPVAFVFITVMHIVFGELAPKSMAIQLPVRTTFAIALPLQVFYYIFRPFIWVLNRMATLLLKVIGISAVKGHEAHTSEELQLLLDQGKESGVLDSSEHELIKNVFDFNERPVKKIMIPRTKIAAVDNQITQEELLKTLASENYTRLPVYEETIDNIIGFLHVKDILLKVLGQKPIVIKEILRPVMYIPEAKQISDLLTEMQHKSNPMMAIVLDEFGGTAGLVTMEDIVEELVGEIQDEYDEEKPVVEKVSDTEYIVNAQATISDVNEFLPIPLPEEDEYDSVAGLMNVIFEKIPDLHEMETFGGYECRIIKKSKLNVEMVKLTVLQD